MSLRIGFTVLGNPGICPLQSREKGSWLLCLEVYFGITPHGANFRCKSFGDKKGSHPDFRRRPGRLEKAECEAVIVKQMIQ